MREIVGPAIEQLCVAFDRGGYNPTPIVDIGVLVASADGKVTERERDILLEVFQTLLETKLSAEVVDHLVSASLEVIDVAGAERRTRLVAEILQDCDAVEPGLTVALAVAFSNDGLSKAERVVVERIAAAAAFPADRLSKLVEHVRKHADIDPVSTRSSLSSLRVATER
ncbi:MAG: TerB family tellurite resistance protein [Deltaproteobacteria bacterium]|nr:TerB family tellurite resistance protein [Deltaproteobacteria bacterium]